MSRKYKSTQVDDKHYCPKCDWATFNNKSRSPGVCPKCGNTLEHEFDEPKEYDE